MRLAAFIFLLAAFAAVEPWIHLARSPSLATMDRPGPSVFPGWSAAPIPEGLWSVPLTERDQRFARRFPGRIATFSDGTRTWIVRWVEQPTRSLHPAGDCLRAAGYEVTPTSARIFPDGTLWSASKATRDQDHLCVRERIFEPSGPAGWSDVSAWYWHALLGQSKGPWWAVTVIEKQT